MRREILICCLFSILGFPAFKMANNPFVPFVEVRKLLWDLLKKLWIYYSREIFSNHWLSIILVIFLEMANNPFIPFSKISKLLWDFDFLKIMSTSIKSMCWEILICCLLSILSLSTFEVANNPFVPLSQICKLLRDFAFLKIDHTAFKSMWSEILACCLFSILCSFTIEMSHNPFIPFVKVCKLLWDGEWSFLKKLWWCNLSREMFIDNTLDFFLFRLIKMANNPVLPSLFRSKVKISFLQVLTFKLFLNPLSEFLSTQCIWILNIRNEFSDSIWEVLLNHWGRNFGRKTFSIIL